MDSRNFFYVTSPPPRKKVVLDGYQGPEGKGENMFNGYMASVLQDKSQNLSCNNMNTLDTSDLHTK